jgi:hypothetical protein
MQGGYEIAAERSFVNKRPKCLALSVDKLIKYILISYCNWRPFSEMNSFVGRPHNSALVAPLNKQAFSGSRLLPFCGPHSKMLRFRLLLGS